MSDTAPRRKKKAPSFLAQGVGKSYGDVEALVDVDLRVERGELVALIGHNGSGKSTLLKLAAGLLDLTRGSIRIAGRDAGSLGARAALSYVSDDPVLYDDLSLWEHVEYLSRLHGFEEWETSGRDLIERFGLTDRVDQLPSGFSRGLRQKTALVLGLARRYRVLAIDEPFVGLDGAGKAALVELLEERRAKGSALLIATHELSLVQRADRCVALRDGRIIHDGPIDQSELAAFAS